MRMNGRETPTDLESAPIPTEQTGKPGIDICKICVIVLLALIGAEDMIGTLI
mgnify:CR=1 FL=1